MWYVDAFGESVSTFFYLGYGSKHICRKIAEQHSQRARENKKAFAIRLKLTLATTKSNELFLFTFLGSAHQATVEAFHSENLVSGRSKIIFT